jgi:hypothetical protein
MPLVVWLKSYLTFVIISITVVSESIIRNGKMIGRSLNEELRSSSLCNGSTTLMASLLKLTKIGAVTYFENPTYKESKDLGPPANFCITPRIITASP